jgi:N-acetylmuramoyl-L-alanine amidase
MIEYGRSRIAAFAACALLLSSTSFALPSTDAEAAHRYTVACRRLADLKKSPQKKKYRSYWMDCAKTFEFVEKKYPRSPSAGDACFDRAGIYRELYLFNKFSKDLDETLNLNKQCRADHPNHARAPEALYRIIELSRRFKKDGPQSAEALSLLSQNYPDSAWTARAKARATPVVREKKKNRKEPELRPMPVPVLAAPGSAQPTGVIRSIRYWSGGAYTRIVIEQSDAVNFKVTDLKKPDRLVFDLQNARLQPSASKSPLTVDDGILKQVRISQYAHDIVRIVLDLASMKNYVAFPLHEPERLVIDVTGEGGAAAQANTAVSPTAVEDGKPVAAHNAAPEFAVNPPPAATGNGGDRLSLSRQLGLKIKTIAIDAGHGGHDPGAIGRSGLKEKTITLDIAKRLATLVKDRLGCNVVMTRDKDVFIPLEDRPAIAKTRGADLFVSIHVNANRKRKAKGIETYIQSLRATDRDAMATAARENAMSTKKLSELKSELDRIFADLTRDDKLEESLQLAHSVQGSLVDVMKPAQGQVVNLGVKRAFFYVLINTEMPSILAEVGFISNPDEEKLLKTDSYRQAAAEALFQGVKRYVEARGPQMLGI